MLNLQVFEMIEELKIWSVTGTLVLQKSKPEKQLDISSLKNGIYIIQVQTTNKRMTGKFTVSR
jgi:hypothetical protein